ncbi:MAG TPA: hypothetical protein VF443_08415, partial [Nitrospira sp.]
LERIWPFLGDKASYPSGSRYSGSREPAMAIIYTLNDTDQWTREQIADWVSEIEKERDRATQTAANASEIRSKTEEDRELLAMARTDR